MKRKRAILFASSVVLGVSAAAFVFLLLQVRKDWTQVVYHGDEAIRYVQSNPYLRSQWMQCDIGTNMTEFVEVIAAAPMFQSGARFYARVSVDSAEWQDMNHSLAANEDIRFDDPVLKVTLMGKKSVISPRVGHDGPELAVYIEDSAVGIVTYYGYAGDG